jgi:predicted GIY-YIG superfamily endonuclease
MKIPRIDFMLLQYQGIRLFMETVEEMVRAGQGDHATCMKLLWKQLMDYSAAKSAFSEMPVAAPVPVPLTVTLSELLDHRIFRNGAFEGVRRNVVYIIKNGDEVLYVGSTRHNARSRIKSHQKARSPLGTGLRQDPTANTWSIEMIPHADYKAAAQKEKELIRQLRPSFCRRVT